MYECDHRAIAAWVLGIRVMEIEEREGQEVGHMKKIGGMSNVEVRRFHDDCRWEQGPPIYGSFENPCMSQGAMAPHAHAQKMGGKTRSDVRKSKETRRQCINDQNESERLDTGGKVDIVCPRSASGGWYRG
jgi:hypothetical protein